VSPAGSGPAGACSGDDVSVRAEATHPTPPHGGARPPVLETRQLSKDYLVGGTSLRRSGRHVKAVDGVDIRVGMRETLGLVGESGSGKSTLARMVMRLLEPTAGTIALHGRDITRAHGASLRAVRSGMQMVFQDPYSSFDPMASVGDSVAEPLQAHRGAKRRSAAGSVARLFDLVGLSSAHASRYPSELSGGQLQRAAIARALSVEPDLLVLDEPVSSLDVSTQAQVINLLVDLQREFSFACLFISHDLSIVRQISDRIAVMYLGRIVESGPVDELYTSPKHPYTAALLSAIPQPTPGHRSLGGRIMLHGDIPSPLSPPSGCHFRTRCPYAMPVCAEVVPPPYHPDDASVVNCHLHTSGPQLAGRSVLELAGSQANIS
jgi:peptide/nickel transport system ATP-binding protein